MHSATYQPALITAQLKGAVWELGRVRVDVEKQLRNAENAAHALHATGFAGPAADAAVARIHAQQTSLRSHHAELTRIRIILETAAELHERLDHLADLAARYGHYRIILWLNQLSFALDEAAGDALRTNIPHHTIDELFHHPDLTLDELHAHHAATVPAATQRTIAEHGATILEAGPGSTTVMVGDTHSPTRIITMVAGTHTGKPEDLGRELDKAQRIAARTGAAVVVWQGYGPPANLPDAGIQTPARRGAGNLSRFQAALDERFPDAQKTIVAHSYGTLLPTRAATEGGLLVDDLWLVGSAGVAGQSVDDLTLAGPDSEVYVVDSPEDIILALRSGPAAALGASPSHPDYGATAVEGVAGSHTDYFTDPAFLSALAQGAHDAPENR